MKVLCLDRRGQASAAPKIHRVTAANTKILLVSCQSEPKDEGSNPSINQSNIKRCGEVA